MENHHSGSQERISGICIFSEFVSISFHRNIFQITLLRNERTFHLFQDYKWEIGALPWDCWNAQIKCQAWIGQAVCVRTLTVSYREGEANGWVTCTHLDLPEKWLCQRSFILKASSWTALIFVYIPGSLPGGPRRENTGEYIAWSWVRVEGKLEAIGYWKEKTHPGHLVLVYWSCFWARHLWLCHSNVPTTKWKRKHLTGCSVTSDMKHLIDILDRTVQILGILEFQQVDVCTSVSEVLK